MYNGITVSQRRWRNAALALLCCLGAALSQLVNAQQAELAAAVPVGSVNLVVAQSSSEQERLDVGLVIFNPGIPLDASTHSMLGIFPVIRKAEAQFMPGLLRQVLVASDAWGVVRVLPDHQASAELLVTGKILQSNGTRLVILFTARDATGRVWVDKAYADVATERDYPGVEGSDPFIDLYHQFANDLLAFRQRLDQSQLRSIRQVAQMRYAASLSEEAFGSYLAEDAQGNYTVLRLPADGDPMMARVERIRNQEHLFVDTVDEQYVNLYEEMAPTYNLWRQYSLEQAMYLEDFEVRAQNRDRIGQRGSFTAMEQTYNTYKQIKIQEQDLDDMALGFNTEVAPTAMEASGKVFRLTGTLDTQYNEWRSILREIFAIETGLTPGA